MNRVGDPDAYVPGNLSCESFTPPAGCISDDAVQGAAGIQATKLQHSYVGKGEPNGATGNAAVGKSVMHVVRGATGVIEDFSVFDHVAALGAATCTIDLLKNGVSILAATYNITSALAAYALHSIGGFTSADVVAGDVLEISITAAAAGGGTLPIGVCGVIKVFEDAN